MTLFEQISAEYGLVLMVAVALGFQCLLFGFFFPGKARGKYFNKDFMKTFAKDHANASLGEIKAQGYPDMGDGRYSAALSYKDWYKFNCAQRVHLNFVEQIATSILVLLVAGLIFPIYAAALGVLLVVGRLVYGIGYMISSTARVPGALMIDVGMLGLTGLAFYSSFKIANRRKWF